MGRPWATATAALALGCATLVRGATGAAASSAYYVAGSASSAGKCKVWLNGKGSASSRQAQAVAQSWGDHCHLYFYDYGAHDQLSDRIVKPGRKASTAFYPDRKQVYACLENSTKQRATCTPKW